MLQVGAPIGRDTCFGCADLSRVGCAIETAGRSGAGGRTRARGVQATSSCPRGKYTGASRTHANSDSYSGTKTNDHGAATAGRMDVGCKAPVCSGSSGIRSNATRSKIPRSVRSKLLDRRSGRTALRPVAKPLKRITHLEQHYSVNSLELWSE